MSSPLRPLHNRRFKQCELFPAESAVFAFAISVAAFLEVLTRLVGFVMASSAMPMSQYVPARPIRVARPRP